MTGGTMHDEHTDELVEEAAEHAERAGEFREQERREQDAAAAAEDEAAAVEEEQEAEAAADDALDR
jgi:hypothetical protein